MEENGKQAKIKERTRKQVEGKWAAHVKEKEGKQYWTFDCGRKVDISPKNMREQLMQLYHEKLNHRCMTTVYYAIEKYYWPEIKNDITDKIKKCEKCQIYNRKRICGCDFVDTTRYLEKVAMKLIDFRYLGKYVLVAIDYFTRRVWAQF